MQNIYTYKNRKKRREQTEHTRISQLPHHGQFMRKKEEKKRKTTANPPKKNKKNKQKPNKNHNNKKQRESPKITNCTKYT